MRVGRIMGQNLGEKNKQEIGKGGERENSGENFTRLSLSFQI